MNLRRWRTISPLKSVNNFREELRSCCGGDRYCGKTLSNPELTVRINCGKLCSFKANILGKNTIKNES
jgi:hypothetical protein